MPHTLMRATQHMTKEESGGKAYCENWKCWGWLDEWLFGGLGGAWGCIDTFA